ncbi:MAG: XdhC family protein [Veillonellaceae bacterium]|nr:XdhC family protein [Veillonellaceae bacterium]
METMYDSMARRLEADGLSFLVTQLSGPKAGQSSIYTADNEVVYGEVIEGLRINQQMANALVLAGDIECFVEPIQKDSAVLVLGAGHVSRCITDLLVFIGCQVTVADDRTEYLKPVYFDERVTRKQIDFEAICQELPVHTYKGIIIVTRAHEFDSTSLKQLRPLLGQTYMGIMGSQKRIYYAFQQLKKEGWTDKELSYIHGPIGLDIDAQTPEEIAISIVGEYLAATRGRDGRFLSQKREEGV